MDGEDFEENVAQSACEIGWNRLDGYYAVSFQFSSEDYPVEDLSKVTITLDGVEYTKESGEKVSVSVPTITLKNNTATPAPHQKKSRLASELSTDHSLLNVYNIQGMLVKEGINKSEVKNLPAGLYIIEGKKIIVH